MNREPTTPPVAQPAAATAMAPGSTPVPVTLFIALAGLLYWGMLYLDRHAAGFDAHVYPPFRSVKEVEACAPKDPHRELYNRGRNLFGAYCAVCHQATGLGSPGIAPPLAGSEWPLAPGPNRVIRIVLNGLGGPIEVKGQQYTFPSPMLPFRDALKDEDVAAVLTYVRGSKDWGHKASAVDPAQVKAIRDATADKGGPWAPDELLKIPDAEAAPK